MTAAELWEQYRPKIAEARERDRRDVQRSLVSIPDLVGRAWVVPMTLERLIVLESIEHPFLKGDYATRDDVLNFLWIMSPEFVGGNPKATKRFFRRFWFRRIDEDSLRDYLAEEFANEKQTSGKVPDANWVAHLVDVFAHEYGWAENEILNIPIKRLFRYADAIVARHGENKVSFSPQADKLKHEYLKEMEKIRLAALAEKELTTA